MNPNDLFSVFESSPSAEHKTDRTDFWYRLTLILRHEEGGLLFLSSPGSAPSFPGTAGVETIIQVVFSDFLVDLFQMKPFDFIGQFLRRLPGSLRFSPEAVAPVKEVLVRLRTGVDFEAGMQFLYAMKALAGAAGMPEMKEESGAPSSGHPADDKTDKVKRYVMENFRNPIKISEVAGIAGVSATNFSRFFKQHARLKFSDYVNSIRVEKASRRLLTTDETVSEIAYDCGFGTPCYFNEVFKRYKGVTPERFRGGV